MPTTVAKLATIVEDYLADLRRIRASGGATGERSYYPPLNNLLAAVGATLKPKVICVGELAQQGAAGWGRFGQGEAITPGQGRDLERPYTAPEQAKRIAVSRPVTTTASLNLKVNVLSMYPNQGVHRCPASRGPVV